MLSINQKPLCTHLSKQTALQSILFLFFFLLPTSHNVHGSVFLYFKIFYFVNPVLLSLCIRVDAYFRFDCDQRRWWLFAMCWEDGARRPQRLLRRLRVSLETRGSTIIFLFSSFIFNFVVFICFYYALFRHAILSWKHFIDYEFGRFWTELEQLFCRKELNCRSFRKDRALLAWLCKGCCGQLLVIRF